MEEIDKELSMNPNKASLYQEKGKILFSNKKYQEALESYLLAFEKEERREYAEDVSKVCEKILEQNPNDVVALLFYGSFLEMSDADKSVGIYHKILELQPDSDLKGRVEGRIKHLERKKISKEKLF